ncbi:MAG: methyltransferase domain-containing protein, partial [Anaerolineales bacterium]|nr:methyltransferase domain-containing protein [Anaerolineales bacterium]
QYLRKTDGHIVPRAGAMPLINDDIRRSAVQEQVGPADLVVSSSVYEHLDDVDGVTHALAAVTAPGGLHIHFVDLRDHFFKYPFEMLTYSDSAWKHWLNPSSNHNRFRFNDYKQVFERWFDDVEFTVLSREPEAFAQARPRIRPEFLTGDPAIDSVTSIRVLARRPSQ